MRLTARDRQALDSDLYNGSSDTKTAAAAAAEWDLSPSVFGQRGPIKLEIESRDAAAYISIQGATGVALTGGGVDRMIPAGGSIYIYVTDATDSYVSVQRVVGDAVLVATCVGRLIQ